MKRIALVNQRYGLEVNGGSEYYTRLVAEKLKNDYEVEILTSKALSYEKWADYYQDDVEDIHGVTVRRFSVLHERNDFLMKILSRIITRLHLNTKALCALWVRCQGPYVPELVEYIRRNKERYCAIIFVTYLYYPTVVGMQQAKEKAIFIPTAHDEPYIHFKSHAPLFQMPRAFIYLTQEERDFVQGLYHNEHIPSVVAGVGVDLPGHVDAGRFRDKFHVEGDYVVYVGRVDKSKGCAEMIAFFRRFRDELIREGRQAEGLPTLVIMGQKFMEIPHDLNIRYLGFVSEEDKFDALQGAKALWLPSQFESLSISVLEAMSLQVPVLVNGNCEVLKGHVQKSRGGMYYTEYAQCRNALYKLLYQEQERGEMGKNAYQYIEKNYLWDKILDTIKGLIEGI